MYRVKLTKSALKQQKKLSKPYQQRVIRALVKLQENPGLGKPLRGEFQAFHSFRAWPLRIIYELNLKTKIVIIHKIAHRQSSYK